MLKSTQTSEGVPAADARQSLTDATVAILAAYRKHCSPQSPPAQLILPDALKLLPIYALATLRCAALARDKTARPDERVAHRHLVLGAPLAIVGVTLYPRLVALHSADDAVAEQAMAVLPAALPRGLPLARSSLADNGIYLLHCATEQYVWFEKQVRMQSCRKKFILENVI